VQLHLLPFAAWAGNTNPLSTCVVSDDEHQSFRSDYLQIDMTLLFGPRRQRDPSLAVLTRAVQPSPFVPISTRAIGDPYVS
jgi:hypothetical protein